MSEWLAQITPDTPYQEMLERPSAFNPEPELADANLEIARIGALTGRDNIRRVIRYSSGVMYEVEWPMQQPVKEGDAETRLIDDTEALEGRSRVAISSFERFDHFWEPQAAALVHQRLVEDGTLVFDKIFGNAQNKGRFGNPRIFMQYVSIAFEQTLERDMPGAAYAVAQSAFNDVVKVRGRLQRCEGLRHWLEEDIVHVIEPGLSLAIRNAQATGATTEYGDLIKLNDIRGDVAARAIDLAQCNWTMRALKMADEQYADENPALTEKIVWHQIFTGRRAIIAAQDLVKAMNAVPETVRGATSLRPEGQTPQQIGSYVLDILN